MRLDGSALLEVLNKRRQACHDGCRPSCDLTDTDLSVFAVAITFYDFLEQAFERVDALTKLVSNVVELGTLAFDVGDQSVHLDLERDK